MLTIVGICLIAFAIGWYCGIRNERGTLLGSKPKPYNWDNNSSTSLKPWMEDGVLHQVGGWRHR